MIVIKLIPLNIRGIIMVKKERKLRPTKQETSNTMRIGVVNGWEVRKYNLRDGGTAYAYAPNTFKDYSDSMRVTIGMAGPKEPAVLVTRYGYESMFLDYDEFNKELQYALSTLDLIRDMIYDYEHSL